MKKSLILLSAIAATSIAIGASTPMMASTNAAIEYTAFLVLSSVGRYSGSETVQDIPDLYLENAIEYIAPAGEALPGKDKVYTIDDSVGEFAGWVAYEGKGAPTLYTEMPARNNLILYAFFNEGVQEVKTLTSLTYEGTFTKTTYDLALGETFTSEGVTIYANFSDDSKIEVTNDVTWSPIKVGSTSVTASYTYKGVTKTVTIDGLTVTGTQTASYIYLNASQDLGGSKWDSAGAWFAAYCWNASGNEWFKMDKDAETGYYVADIDAEAFTNIIFVRFANTATEMNWSSKIWNQTVDLTFEGNCFTVTSWGNGKSVGSWSNI